MRNRLIHGVGRTEVALERLALDILDETPPDVRIRQDRDREVSFGHELEQQDVPAESTAVTVRVNRTDLPNVPRKSDVVVGTLLVQLRRTHLLQRLLLQHARTTCSGSIAEVKAGVRHQICHANANPTRSNTSRRNEWTLQPRRTISRYVTRSEAVDDKVPGRRPCVLQA
jgi:hypothetical protein